MGNGTYWDGENWSNLQVDSPFDKAKVFVQATAPAAPTPMRTGDLFVDTDTRKVQFRNGSTWTDISAGLETINISDVVNLQTNLDKLTGASATITGALNAQTTAGNYVFLTAAVSSANNHPIATGPAGALNVTRSGNYIHQRVSYANGGSGVAVQEYTRFSADGGTNWAAWNPVAAGGTTATTFATGNHTHTKSNITDFAHTHVLADIPLITATVAELNILDGVTATAAELNILDGVTATAAEINILDGVTSTASELNILDGVTVTNTKINFLTDVTGNIQAQIDLKAPKANPVFTGTVTGVNRVESPDGDRTNTRLPTTSPRQVRYDFTNAGAAGTAGNYAGVMTYAPWDGTSGSTGDASYQLAFGGTAVNGGGVPMLNIRKGIDSTWNSWYTIYHSGNSHSHNGSDIQNIAPSVESTATSWNSLTNVGFFPNLMHGTSNPNGPGIGIYYYVTTYAYSGLTGNVTQVAYPYSSADTMPLAMRNRYSGTWSAWQLVGMDSGSNANGTYVRLGDGTQICWHRVSINPTANAPTGYTWTFPIAFSTLGGGFVTADTTVPYDSVRMVSMSDPLTTSMKAWIYRVNSTNTNLNMMAIGRWY